MSEHRIQLKWSRETATFDYAAYNRSHAVTFKNDQALKMSAAPAYKGDPSLVDPEEAFVASLSSCHMLTFLAIASRKKLVVDRYVDDAVGVMEKNDEGKLAVTRVTHRPRIEFSGTTPDDAALSDLHDQAHHECFIASSVKTHVTVESPAAAM
jgi:organic hydroperoxide reductase OsmC/OhrA